MGHLGSCATLPYLYQFHLNKNTLLALAITLFRPEFLYRPDLLCLYRCERTSCHKQYIGETKRRLKDRFNEHRRPVDKQTNSSKPTTVSEHFLSNDHNASDMLLIPLELIKSNCDSVRKAREAYLIDRGQIIEPLGLNRRDET